MRVGRGRPHVARPVVRPSGLLPSPRPAGGAGRGALRILSVLLLLASVLAPFAQSAGATPRPRPVAQIQDSQRDGAPPPIPEPTRVIAIGSFQTAIGCPANDDPTCDLTELGDDGGIWSGSFLLPPGQYVYRALATTPDGDVSLGEDGDPEGQDIPFTVTTPGGGAYFVYDTHTGEVSATPFDEEITLQIDTLGVVALEPIENGEYEVFFTSPPGVYPYQVQSNGEPIGTPDQINLGAESRVHIVVDGEGQTLVKETVDPAALTVLKADDAGQSLAGSCFALFETGNDLANQACDGDDGTEDGSTLLFFPNGVAPGTLELVETLVPEGQEAAEDQDVQVGPGGQTLTVQVASSGGEGDDVDTVDDVTATTEGDAVDDGADPTETPAGDDVVIDGGDDDSGITLTLESRDATTGEPVPGACFRVETQTDEVCDEDDDADDGFVSLDGVDPGNYVITETRPPDGYLTVGSFSLDVFVGGGEEYFIPHSVDPAANVEEDPTATATSADGVNVTTNATETPDRTVRDPDGTGVTLRLESEDQLRNTITGACFDVAGEGEVCDGDDGDVDGFVTFEGIDPGTYEVTETRAPDGHLQIGGSFPITVVESETNDFYIQHQVDPNAATGTATTASSDDGPSGSLRITTLDGEGNPIEGVCYEVAGDETVEVCDGAGEDAEPQGGLVQIDGLPEGDYAVRQTDVPGDFTLATEQTISILGGQGNVGVSAVTELTVVNETSAEQTGSLVVIKVDEDGDALGGACFELVDPLDGSSVAPETCDEDGDVADDGRIGFSGVPIGTYTLRETRTPAGYQTAGDQTVTVETGEVQVSSAAAPVPDEGGEVEVRRLGEDDAVVSGACFELVDDSGVVIGPVCDDQPGDGDPSGGTVVFSDIAPGSYDLTESTTPDGFETAEVTQVEVDSGETTEVQVQTDQVEPPFGTLRVDFQDGEGEPVEGACVNVANGAGEFGPFCDDRFDGLNDGTVTIPDVERGANVVSVVTSPAGFAPADGQDVQDIDVVGGDEANLTITFDASFGNVRVVLTDAETGASLGGACFTLAGPGSYGPACDGEDTDADPDSGAILFEDVATGTYTVTQTRTPDDFDPAGEASVDVLRDETVELPLQNIPTAPDPGSVEVISLDDEGERLAGACFGLVGTDGVADVSAVCDGDAADGGADDGVITITGVAPGVYELTETRTPEGFVAATAQSVTIDPGATTRVEVRHDVTPPETGSIVVRVTGPGGDPVAGACFTIGAPRDAVCDGDDADAAAEEGSVGFGDLEAGDYVVVETSAPDGLVSSGDDRQDVTVVGGEAVEVTFGHGEAPAETGGVRVLVEDDAGQVVEGACMRLSGAGGEFGPVCDNGEGDGDDAVGVILFEGVPAGTYQVTRDGGEGIAGADAAEARSVTAVAGVTVEVLIIIIVDAPDAADLLVTKLNERGQFLGGACFALVSGEDEIEICDGDANDADGTVGEIRFDDVPTGGYVLVESRVPDGYQDSGDQEVSIEGGGDGLVGITVVNQPIPAATGDVVVLKVDAAGDRLGGACFALLSGVVEIARACDEDGDVADDGRIGILDVVPGTYTLREVRRPSTSYVRAGDQTVTVTAGGVTELTVENRLRPATLVVEKVDPEDGRLTGACFALVGSTRYDRCDDDDFSGDDGEITFAGIVPGDYVLVETVAPAGYAAADDRDVTLAPGQRLVLAVENVLLPPPVEAGDLDIFKVGPDGLPLPGACFALLRGDQFLYGPRCDAGDGSADGTISFSGVGAGEYVLRETRLPSADYQAAGDSAVTVTDGETTEVVIENIFKRGRVLVRKVNAQGHLLQGACFDLSPDGGEARCTAASGTVVFSDLEPGTYTLDETQAPAGYLEAETIEGIIVEPGATTVITVEDELAPPPPNTGSLQVFKFYCPAGSAGERTIIFDSSDGDASQLARTSDCTRGNADFTLRSPDGGLGEVTFSTGDDGAYARGLEAGTYVLREVAPDLPGEASETLGIAVNQLTTIVVINEVAPPAPAPVTINVVKYTCEPGFAGTIYADFVDNCAADSGRTNNVTFRVSGPVAARGITGDGGTAGVTSFARIPAGTYTLSEDVYDQASSVYSFCGLDPAAPNIRSFGPSTGFTLAAGTTITCAYFNVPDDLTETTGAILVHKFTCPVDTPPSGYDFESSCGRQGTAAQFSLAVYSAEVRDFVPRLTGYTNTDGVLRISRLQPGRYELTEIGDSWCYAESDNVNRDGNLIVVAGERTEVFIYNCSPVEQEPNTGSGTMAESISRQVPVGAGLPLAIGGAGLIFALAAGLRRRSQAA